MATNNAHVFISYSRRNIDFAKLLFQELSKNDRDVWVDWEDIPRGADWLAEIYRGIDNADTFIFLVSEHSLVSEICNQELDYALRNHKKIIPLILQEINEDVQARVEEKWQASDWADIAHDNWTALKHINWIFFNNPAKYKSEFEALLHTVDQDLFHLKTHTRLLVRAQEWHVGKRKSSSLLQGDDLIGAEHWLKTYQDVEPLPTDLHRDFVIASREQENKRLEHEARLQRRSRTRLQILVASLAIIIGVVVALLPVINQQVEDQLAEDIDERLNQFVVSFRELLRSDEDLAVALADLISGLSVLQDVGMLSDDAITSDLELTLVDFDLQEVSFFWANFDYGDAPAYSTTSQLNYNDRVNLLRADLVLDALEFENLNNDIVLGSPTSQVIASAPVYDFESGELIGAVLIAIAIDNEYLQQQADILGVESVLASLDGEIVATTSNIDASPQVQERLSPYLGEMYIYDDMHNERSYFDFSITRDGIPLRVITTPLLLNDADQEVIQEGILFVGSSFESVRNLQAYLNSIVSIFSASVAGVVVVLLIFLVGIPYLQNRSAKQS